MYLNARQHIVSQTLMGAAIINIFMAIATVFFRRLFTTGTSSVPDMLNRTYWRMQLLCAVLQIGLTFILFLVAIHRVRRSMSTIQGEDFLEMAKLQEEYLQGKHSVLPARTILELLEMWAAILVGIDIVYTITSQLYQRFIGDVLAAYNISDPGGAAAFYSVYNSSHGFKYIGMLTAIALGVAMTGIVLQDKLLMLIAIILVGIFLALFALAGMQTISVGSHSYAIVWTSVLFHLLLTAGLFLIAFYIRHRYVGV